MSPWFTDLLVFQFLDFKPKEVYHAARFEKDRRYYVLRLEKDLLGDWTIRAINGRIKSKLGQSRTLAFPSFSDAFVCLCAMGKHRFQRGYSLKTIACENRIFLHLLPYLDPYEADTNQSKKKKPTFSSQYKQPQKTNTQQMSFNF